jgi:4-hydroxy-2-oxoglutarate aldolase
MNKPFSSATPDLRLQGVMGPLVTPFGRDGDSLDVTALQNNVAAHLNSGLTGVLVGGSTGEAALLDEDERVLLVESARAVVPESRALLVGVGGESTRQTIRRARAAASRGADGVLVVAPHYYLAAMTADVLYAHFTAVADASPVPVLLYNIPKYAHLVLEPSLVERLCEHSNVVGIKDSSGDMDLLARYVEVQKRHPRFTVLTGHGPTFATALRIGARGGILALALFSGDITPRIFDGFRRGDLALANELQALVINAAREVVGVFGVPGVKCAMDLVGLRGGGVRSPLQNLPVSSRDAIEALLRQMGSPESALHV